MHQTYLVLIEDGTLALAVGAALQDRLAADGRPALAFVPSRRGTDAEGDGDLRRAGLPGGRPPQVVALQEDGLLARLESLGLAAYVGVPEDQNWHVVHWNDEAGAMMLPAATVRDLADAVADHAPWHAYAAPSPDVALWRESAARRAGRSRKPAALRGAASAAALSLRLFPAPALSRKLAVASAAGPVLLAGLPAAAAASTSAQHGSAYAGDGSGAAVRTASAARVQPAASSQAAGAGTAGWLTGLLQDPVTPLGNSATTGAGASDLRAQIPRLARLAAGTETAPGSTVPSHVLPLGTALGMVRPAQSGTGAMAAEITAGRRL